MLSKIFLWYHIAKRFISSLFFLEYRMSAFYHIAELVVSDCCFACANLIHIKSK